MKFQEKQLLLYAVTDRAWIGTLTLYQQIEQAILGGVTCIQLREKNLDEETFIKEAIQVRKLCHKHGIPLIINDNLKVALESGADGIHVGNDDMPVKEIRKITGEDFIIGATAKTIAQAKEAEKAGANYLGVGAVFPSPTKTNAIRITSEALREICSSVRIPVVAIGGITEENMAEITGCGMKGIAVVSAIFSAENIRTATGKLREKIVSIL